MDSELLTADQVADRLRVSPRTVREWSRRGRIPRVRVSAKVLRYLWPAVLSALSGGAGPGSDPANTDNVVNRSMGTPNAVPALRRRHPATDDCEVSRD